MTSEFRPDSDSEYSTLETLTHRRLVPNQGSVEKIDGGLQARSGRDLTAGRVLDPDS